MSCTIRVERCNGSISVESESHDFCPDPDRSVNSGLRFTFLLIVSRSPHDSPSLSLHTLVFAPILSKPDLSLSLNSELRRCRLPNSPPPLHIHTNNTLSFPCITTLGRPTSSPHPRSRWKGCRQCALCLGHRRAPSLLFP